VKGHDDLAAHDLPLEVRVAVVLTGAVVVVAADRLVRGQFLQPVLMVGKEASLVVIDIDRGSNVHRIDEDQHVISHILLSPLFQPMPS